jgi:hypothetical protein
MTSAIGTIGTERLLLPVRPGDAEPFFRLLGNWGVVRWLSSPPWPDNAASLRVQEKLGFERIGEMMPYCRPRGEKRAHLNTKLTRSAF